MGRRSHVVAAASPRHPRRLHPCDLNLLAKHAAAAGPAFVFAYNVVACVAYLPWVVWLIANRELTWNWPVAVCLLFSAMIHLGYSLCLQRGYQVADLSVVYPIARGTGPLLSSIGAFIILAEAPSLQSDCLRLSPASAASSSRAISPLSAGQKGSTACAGASPPAR
jgi:hypothetical protein